MKSPGAYTGEVSADMLKDLGVKYVIIGHSERRQYFGETDFTVNKKVLAALEAGLHPIICVGESLEQRELGITMELIALQVKSALAGVPAEKLRKCVIAYEPIWAIGTGKTATAEQAAEVCTSIRTTMRQLYGARVARSVTIQYGGSMNARQRRRAAGPARCRRRPHRRRVPEARRLRGASSTPPTRTKRHRPDRRYRAMNNGQPDYPDHHGRLRPDGPRPRQCRQPAPKRPSLDRLFAEYAHTTLSASGLDVGLPDGQMGNSEVGHTNIGAGRVVFQDLPRISRAIDDGSFFENAAYCKAMDDCLEKGSSLHLYGLLSDGGVHSHIQHLYALLQMARSKGLDQGVCPLLSWTAGTCPPPAARASWPSCQDKCRDLGVGKIATVMGRYYAMDRDNRWERVQMAYDAMVYGEGVQQPRPGGRRGSSPMTTDVTDEFVEPVVCDPDGTYPTRATASSSSTSAPTGPGRSPAPSWTRTLTASSGRTATSPSTYVCTTEYDATMPNVQVAFPRSPCDNSLGRVPQPPWA